MQRQSSDEQRLKNGTIVVLKGLQTRPEFNGQHATVEAWDDATGRYSVCIVNAAHWSGDNQVVLAVRREKLAIAGGKEKAAPPPPPLPPPPPPPPPETFAKDEVVVLTGLVQLTELNGYGAVVQGWDGERSRYIVCVTDRYHWTAQRKVIAVKPANLKRAPPVAVSTAAAAPDPKRHAAESASVHGAAEGDTPEPEPQTMCGQLQPLPVNETEGRSDQEMFAELSAYVQRRAPVAKGRRRRAMQLISMMDMAQVRAAWGILARPNKKAVTLVYGPAGAGKSWLLKLLLLVLYDEHEQMLAVSAPTHGARRADQRLIDEVFPRRSYKPELECLTTHTQWGVGYGEAWDVDTIVSGLELNEPRKSKARAFYDMKSIQTVDGEVVDPIEVVDEGGQALTQRLEPRCSSG